MKTRDNPHLRDLALPLASNSFELISNWVLAYIYPTVCTSDIFIAGYLCTSLYGSHPPLKCHSLDRFVHSSRTIRLCGQLLSYEPRRTVKRNRFIDQSDVQVNRAVGMSGFSRRRYISPRETRPAITLKRSYCILLSVVAFCWKDVWHEHNTQKLVAGDNTVARVSPLKPATTYHFRVLAENHLGTSAPSDILHVSIKHCRKTKNRKKRHTQSMIERKKNFHIITNIIINVALTPDGLFFFTCAVGASRNFRNRCKRMVKCPVDLPGTSPWSPWARSSSRSRGNRRIDPCGTANYSDTPSATPISGIVICLPLLNRGSLLHLASITLSPKSRTMIAMISPR